ncbi:uncharacterized protein A4U43_C05F7990 [Asparagus officinalis]|uniref:Uncharacterized protein n=1 Tax=Asparagus officinalis TaxID=4686 RepID=A0A5P1EQ52_ASPOF|nr:uncharacterized protein A4U43_C05F7990 [Asparagus officinalis]
MDNHKSTFMNGKNNKQEVCNFQGESGKDLWKDGLIFAFEFVRGNRFTSPNKLRKGVQNVNNRRTIHRVTEPESLIDLNSSTPNEAAEGASHIDDNKETLKQYITQLYDSHWVPIGWERIKELVQMVQVDANWASQQINLEEDEDDFTVADVVAPYWERPTGPTWWCHVNPACQSIQSWLSSAQWLHPAISIALRDESRSILAK